MATKPEVKVSQADACASCGSSSGASDAPLKRCSRCHIVKYCSVICQRQHLPDHKASCAATEAAAAIAAKAVKEAAATERQQARQEAAAIAAKATKAKEEAARAAAYVAMSTKPEVKVSQADACAECGSSTNLSGAAFMRCSRCQIAKYCSALCQRKHWAAHKASCAVAEAAGSGNGASTAQGSGRSSTRAAASSEPRASTQAGSSRLSMREPKWGVEATYDTWDLVVSVPTSSA